MLLVASAVVASGGCIRDTPTLARRAKLSTCGLSMSSKCCKASLARWWRCDGEAAEDRARLTAGATLLVGVPFFALFPEFLTANSRREVVSLEDKSDRPLRFENI